MENKKMETMNEQFIMIPRNVFDMCINTLKLIHPTDFDGMDKLVAVVATLLKAAAQGIQEGLGQPEDPEGIKFEVIEPEEQTEEKKKR